MPFEQAVEVHAVDDVPLFASPTSIQVTGDDGERTVQARNIIVATGSTPKSLPFAPIDEEVILSNTGILAVQGVPRHLIVIGGGVVGVEFASAYRSFGSEVTILEALPRLVTTEDEEISAELAIGQRRSDYVAARVAAARARRSSARK